MKWIMTLALAGLLPLAACGEQGATSQAKKDEQSKALAQGAEAQGAEVVGAEMVTVAFRLDDAVT
ncbi:MAG: hypothetical protein CSA62_13370 [Planctomycetota bacterium]|nr:MAG: hypothetical protein CSA62_13370 [Planctomycetota bacterium]